MTDGNNPQNPGGQVYIDPQTGQPGAHPQIDPATGQPVAAQPQIDPATGLPIAAQPQIDPATSQPVAPQPQGQSMASPQNEAFGFSEAPVQEKYNTEYIVKNLQKDERTTQYVIIGLVVAALAGAAMWLLLMPTPEKPSVPTPATAVQAAPAADEEDAGEEATDAAEAKDGGETP